MGKQRQLAISVCSSCLAAPSAGDDNSRAKCTEFKVAGATLAFCAKFLPGQSLFTYRPRQESLEGLYVINNNNNMDDVINKK